MNHERIVPYDTGKVKIGVHYQPPMRATADFTAEEWRIQQALVPTREDRAWRKPFFYIYLAAVLAFMLMIAGAHK